MYDLGKKLDRLKREIQNPDFLSGKGLSNEVNIRMCTYNPKDEMKVRKFVSQLKEDDKLKCNLICINLFDILMEICEEEDLMEDIIELEKDEGSKIVLEELKLSIDIDDYINKMDYENHQVGDVLMITGVGEVFPFLRIHILLEAMQSRFSDIAIVVMYPGKFDGVSLSLFNEFESHAYYRAFNVI